MVKMPEQRKDSRRVPFAEEDGVLGVVIKPEPEGGSFYLQALDVSENGIKFKTSPETDHPCAIWETLFLSEIVGTRRVKFPEPIELVVKWQENEVDQCVFGCQIHRTSPESKKQYVQFVQSEMKFGGVRNLSQIQPAPSGIESEEYEEEEGEMTAWKSRIKGSSTPEETGSRPWGLIAIIVLLAVALVSAFYTCSQNRDLATRVEQMEQGPEVVPAPTASFEQVQTQLDAMTESLAVLKQLAQENRDKIHSIEGKMQALEEEVVQLEARPAPGAPAPVQEKAAAAPAQPKPQETAPKEKSAGSVHVVQKGENLFRISVKYNVSLESLAEANGMKVNDPIYPGQKIKIP